jgi:hypothetical protein
MLEGYIQGNPNDAENMHATAVILFPCFGQCDLQEGLLLTRGLF